MIRSESVTKLMPALLKARAECTPILKTSVNPAFRSKYADLAAIYDAVIPALTANGLVLSHPTSFLDGIVVVETIIVHAASGEYWGCEYPAIPVKNDPQGLGSATTYAKRYGASAILALAADEDDDGNAASHRGNGHAQQAPPRPEPPRTPRQPGVPTAAQIPYLNSGPEPPRTPPQPDSSAWHHWVQTQAKSKGVEPKHLVNHLAKTFCEAGLSPDGKAAVLRGMHADQSQRVKLIADVAKWDPTASKAPATTPGPDWKAPLATATADSDPDMP
jgi:hypothetical protein